MFRYRIAGALLVALALASPAPVARACFLGGLEVPPIDAERAGPDSFILYGSVKDSQKTETGGTTTFAVEKVLKARPAVAGKKTVVIDRHIPIPDAKNPPRFVLIGIATKDTIDVYRGIPDAPGLVDYIDGLLKIDTKDRAKVLRYTFDFLHSATDEIATDALAVFDRATPDEVRTVGPTLDAEKLRKWIGTGNLSYARTQHYCVLLGHCGKPGDAALLRKVLDAPDQRNHGAPLIGYVLVDPKGGHAHLTKFIADPKIAFRPRYGGLVALRYFYDHRPDVLSQKDAVAGMVALMAHADIADMSMDDLRKRKVWSATDAVLRCATLKGHNELPINRRAMIKFALAASQADPTNAAAVAFVAKARKDEPDRVKLLEEILKDEAASEPRPK
ncbi:MAG: hypothetical protein FJ304_20390 [Planctomycetes bacterium]|nr:hypothetical protein [Planctomycetota bacterium]